MARAVKEGRELSWHKGSKQWYRTAPVKIDADGKVVKKRKYFGGGKYESDRTSYNAAREKYRAYMRDWELKQAARAVQRRIQTGQLGDSRLENWLKQNRADLVNVDLSDEDIKAIQPAKQARDAMRGRMRRGRVEAGGPLSISSLMDRWLAEEKLRIATKQLSDPALHRAPASVGNWCWRQSVMPPSKSSTLSKPRAWRNRPRSRAMSQSVPEQYTTIRPSAACRGSRISTAGYAASTCPHGSETAPGR